jgi:tRNA A37 threonylcarbamoyladenosine biosynthesis protein TsaE
MQETRRERLNDIQAWIHTADDDGAAEILCMWDIAGAGKTAIAPTIVRDCFHQGNLAPSFSLIATFQTEEALFD